MDNKNTLKLSKPKAYLQIYALMDLISDKYDVSIKNDNDVYSGFGYICDGLSGDMSIHIGSHMDIERHGFKKYVNDIDFMKIICSLYHEKQHIIQNADYYYKKKSIR